MAGPVESAEAKAKPALARLEQAIAAGQAFAFTSSECERINELIGALRDHQIAGTDGNPMELPCPACSDSDVRRDPDFVCDVCDNLRYVPTEAGRRILDMIERHFITSIEDDVFMTNSDPRLTNTPGESNP